MSSSRSDSKGSNDLKALILNVEQYSSGVLIINVHQHSKCSAVPYFEFKSFCVCKHHSARNKQQQCKQQRLHKLVVNMMEYFLSLLRGGGGIKNKLCLCKKRRLVNAITLIIYHHALIIRSFIQLHKTEGSSGLYVHLTVHMSFSNSLSLL